MLWLAELIMFCFLLAGGCILKKKNQSPYLISRLRKKCGIRTYERILKTRRPEARPAHRNSRPAAIFSKKGKSLKIYNSIISNLWGV